MMIINKPQPNISIQGTPRFKGHYKPIERVVYCFYKIWIVDWSEILIMTLLIRVKARYE